MKTIETIEAIEAIETIEAIDPFFLLSLVWVGEVISS